VISEGVAAVILKRLADAERDGDRIYAVIQGVGSSSDGRCRGLTAPSYEGQVRALERAYAEAGIDPATVGYIEAHGTGTAVGDVVEIEALTRLFQSRGARPGSCVVGSVKSQIGHTKCAAGLAGLIQAALALRHRTYPPTIGITAPNPQLDVKEGAFRLNVEAQPWMQADVDHPRRAGVSAFGFGGTNFHAVLEAYGGDPPAPDPRLAGRAARVAGRRSHRAALRFGSPGAAAVRGLTSPAPRPGARPGGPARDAGDRDDPGHRHDLARGPDRQAEPRP
jgi:acyl transferase domain-containing protein